MGIAGRLQPSGHERSPRRSPEVVHLFSSRVDHRKNSPCHMARRWVCDYRHPRRRHVSLGVGLGADIFIRAARPSAPRRKHGAPCLSAWRDRPGVGLRTGGPPPVGMANVQTPGERRGRAPQAHARRKCRAFGADWWATFWWAGVGHFSRAPKERSCVGRESSYPRLYSKL